MFKWLFVFPLVAFVDPFLLYWIWPQLNFPVRVSVLVVYPLIAGMILQRRAIPERDLFTGYVRLAIRILAWYPGPISKITSLVLILPPIEGALSGWINRRVQAHFLGGINPGGVPQPGAGPYSGGASTASTPNLKPTKGRVID